MFRMFIGNGHAITGAALGTEAEQLLVQRLRRGESGALEEVARAYGPRLLRLAHRLLGWNGDAADALQEVFAKLLARPDRVGGQRGLEAWLVAVTVNRCRGQRRWAMTWRKFLGQRSRDVAPAQSADVEPARREVQQRVRAAVGRMRPRDRQVIVLHYLEEMSVAEIGKTLGISPNAVEVRLHRARQRLKERLTGLI